MFICRNVLNFILCHSLWFSCFFLSTKHASVGKYDFFVQGIWLGTQSLITCHLKPHFGRFWIILWFSLAPNSYLALTIHPARSNCSGKEHWWWREAGHTTIKTNCIRFYFHISSIKMCHFSTGIVFAVFATYSVEVEIKRVWQMTLMVVRSASLHHCSKLYVHLLKPFGFTNSKLSPPQREKYSCLWGKFTRNEMKGSVSAVGEFDVSFIEKRKLPKSK